MKMFSKITLCALAMTGLAYSANAQQIQLAHAYSNAEGVASASPTSNVTIYAARIAGSPEQEIQSASFRIYFNSADTISGFSVPPGTTTSLFTVNTNQGADGANADGIEATDRYGSATPVLTAGFPLRNNVNTVPVGWAPGNPTNGAFEPLLITTFTGVPAAFGFTAPNAANQSGVFVRPWNTEPSGTQLVIAQVAGLTRQPGGVLAVEMVDLSAKATGTGVLVSWETGLEVDNAGFNVYSQPEVATGLTKLNPILIGAAGTAASYSYMDSRSLGAGEVRAYFVEDVDISGLSTTLHGPAVVTGGVSSNVQGWDLY